MGRSWVEVKKKIPSVSGLHPSLVWVPVKVGDEVRAVSGAFKGRTGKVEQADPAFNGNVRCVFCTNEHGVGAFTTEQRNLVKVEASKAPSLDDEWSGYNHNQRAILYQLKHGPSTFSGYDAADIERLIKEDWIEVVGDGDPLIFQLTNRVAQYMGDFAKRGPSGIPRAVSHRHLRDELWARVDKSLDGEQRKAPSEGRFRVPTLR